MCSIENIENKYKFFERLTAYDMAFYKDSVAQEVLKTLEKAIVENILYQEEVLSVDDTDKLTEKFFQHIDEPDLKYEFNLFLSMQYFRSPRIHTNLSASFEEFKILSTEFSDLNTDFYVNLITVFFAEIMAQNLTQKLNTSIMLFQNKSSIPFITGDTPIVNISDNEDLTTLHYPISCTAAVNIVISKIPLKNTVIAVDESMKMIIDNLNRKLYHNCLNEIYSNDRNIFGRYSET